MDQAAHNNLSKAISPIVGQQQQTNQRLRDLETSEGQRLACVASSTESIIANIASVQTLYTATLLANILRTNQIVRGEIPFVYKNSTAGVAALTIAVRYGGSTLFTFDSASPTNNAANRPGLLQFWLWADGSESAQEAFGRLVIGPVLGAASTDQFEIFATGTAAEDDTVDQALDVRITHGTADPNISLTGKLFLVTGPFVP